MDAIVQGGAIALLAVVLLGGGRIGVSLLTRVAVRIEQSFDRLSAALEAMAKEAHQAELAERDRQTVLLDRLTRLEEKLDDAIRRERK